MSTTCDISLALAIKLQKEYYGEIRPVDDYDVFTNLLKGISLTNDIGYIQEAKDGLSKITTKDDTRLFKFTIRQETPEKSDYVILFNIDLCNSFKDGIFENAFIFKSQEDCLPINIDVQEINVVFQINSIDWFEKLLDKNIGIEWIAIAVGFQEEKGPGHRLVCMVNQSSNKAYLMDPNGYPNYFDKAGKQFGTYIESGLHLLFNKIGISYVDIDTWNPRRLAINSGFNTSLVKDGHCVAISHMFAYFLNKGNMIPTELYAKFYKLSKEEKLSLIVSFTMTAYTLLTN
jgi:hypothetical protein